MIDGREHKARENDQPYALRTAQNTAAANECRERSRTDVDSNGQEAYERQELR